MTTRWWVTAAVLQLVSIIGYAASSLPKWANWCDGTTHDRLAMTQGVLISLLAGNIAWILTFYYAQAEPAVCWVVTVLAAYAGETFLAKKMEQFFGRTHPSQ